MERKKIVCCNKRFNKFQFSEALFSTGNSNNAFCKLEKQGKRACFGYLLLRSYLKLIYLSRNLYSASSDDDFL